MWSLGLVFLILMFTLIRKINEIVTTIFATEKFIKENCNVVCVMLVFMTLAVGWLSLWCFSAPLMFSIGKPTYKAGQACGGYEWTTAVTFGFFLNWAMLFINLFLIQGAMVFSLSYVSCAYCFEHDDEHADMNSNTQDSIKWLFSYYYGTVVGTSTMIGILWLPQTIINVFMDIVPYEAPPATGGSGCKYYCDKMSYSCCTPCKSCMSLFVNYISKLDYCDTILRNSDFCEAGCGVITNYSKYSARDKELNQQVEKITTVANVSNAFFSMFVMNLIIEAVAEEANV